VEWDTRRNVAWRTEVPGEGYSSPIVWQDRVFVTSAFDDGMRRAVHCLERRDGKLLWSRELADEDPEIASSMTGHAASTPVTDGRRVVAFFGRAGVIAYDLQGNRLWHRSLGRFESELGLASSPILHGGRVILVCDHDGDRFRSFDSYLIALDAETGETVWKTDRRGLFRSWSTPIVVPRGADGPSELVVNAQDQLRGYDPASGKLLWQVDGMTGWVTPSPVFGQGLIFAASGRDGPVMAVRPGGSGDATATHIAWQHPGGPYVTSPVLYREHLYLCNEQGILSCYAAATGELAYRRRLDGKFFSSPVAGDGKLYVTNDAGQTTVVAAGPQFTQLAQNALEDYCITSPAIAHRSLFLRTKGHLYCIQQPAEPQR
jgi:outer membrane protein assembly factor BamB